MHCHVVDSYSYCLGAACSTCLHSCGSVVELPHWAGFGAELVLKLLMCGIGGGRVISYLCVAALPLTPATCVESLLLTNDVTDVTNVLVLGTHRTTHTAPSNLTEHLSHTALYSWSIHGVFTLVQASTGFRVGNGCGVLRLCERGGSDAYATFRWAFCQSAVHIPPLVTAFAQNATDRLRLFFDSHSKGFPGPSFRTSSS